MTDDGLPRGWTYATLDDVAVHAPASITDGPFGSNLKSEHYTESGPRVVRLQNIGDGRFLDEKAHISLDHFERLRKHEIVAGDVLIAMLGEELPRACVAPSSLGPAIVKADCTRARIEHAVAMSSYVMYALNCDQTRHKAAAIVHGVGRPRLNLGELRSLRFPLAPLAEQVHIVAAIEQHISDIDAGVGALERALLNLKRYRASVLKAACEGKLVPTEAELARKQGRSYETAEVLLKRILKERRQRWEATRRTKYKPPVEPNRAEPTDLPEGWIWTTVETVGDVLLGRQRAPQYLTGKWFRPYLRVANIKDDVIDFTDVESMDFDPEHFEKYQLKPGDILVSEGQSPDRVGESAIYHGGIDGLCFQKTLHRFRPVLSGPPAKFAQIVFRAHVKTGVFRKMASITTNIAHLTLEKFEAAPFPLPPLAEQQRIIAEVERLLSVADETEAAIRAQLARAERLRQSVLQRAFEGKLVPQNPNDEPAGVMLARIREARNKIETTKPARRSVRRPTATETEP